MPRVQLPAVTPKRRAWNKGRLVGQKRPLLPKQVWAIRARLELAGNLRDLALFNVAIDSKLRGCDLVSLKVMAHIVCEFNLPLVVSRSGPLELAKTGSLSLKTP